MKKLIALLLVLIMTLSLFSGCQKSSNLDNYPDKPVTAIVPWGVGGASDLLFRALAATFPKYSGGQPLIVTNIEGGSSVQGVAEYANMQSDGYTVLMWATAQTIKTQMSETPYEAGDFQAIFAAVNDSPYILVRADSEFETVNDLVEFAKANPGQLTMGNSGAGGGNHLAALQFCIAAGIDVNHVPYGGGAASAQATMGGEIDCSMNVPSEGLTSVDSGDLRILAVIGESRMAAYPEVPTAKEMGIDVVNMQTRGAVIHRDAPDGMAEKLEEIFRQVVADPEFQQTLAELSMNVEFATGAEYEKMIADENELYKQIIVDNQLGERYS